MRSFWHRLPTWLWIAGAAVTAGALLAGLRG
jgi:hypothetical protein